MADFSQTTALFKAWCTQRHSVEGTTRLDRLARLVVQNGWAIQPRLFNQIRMTPDCNNPWGIGGLNQHEQLELLYYDGFIAGLALASGNNPEFYKAVYSLIKQHVGEAFRELLLAPPNVKRHGLASQPQPPRQKYPQPLQSPA